MTRAEFGRLVTVIRGVYRDKDFLSDAEVAEIWYSMLKDLTYEQAKMAATKHAMTSKWAPSIADLRAQVVDIQADKADWADGWEEVLRAIRRHGIYNEEAALESMSPMTREVTKRLGWKQICMSEMDELTAIRANFRMIYEQKADKARENAMLSLDLQHQINRLVDSTRLLGVE